MDNYARNFFFGSSSSTATQPQQPNTMNMNQRNHPPYLHPQPNPQTPSGASHFPSHLPNPQTPSGASRFPSYLPNPQTPSGASRFPSYLPNPQTPSGASHFPSHFQLLLAQTQYAHALAQAQIQARLQPQSQAHARLQPRSQAHARLQPRSQAHVTLQPQPSNPLLQSQPHPFVANLHNNINTNVANVANTMAASGNANRVNLRPIRPKKKELSQKQMLKKVATLLPESPLYTQLLDFENQVDAELDRYKFELQEAFKRPSYVQKTLRVYVFNTFSNQNIHANRNGEEASWSLKIVGRILEDNKDIFEAGTSSQASKSPSCPKFSSFFKKITIYLDENLYSDDHVIIWDNARSPIEQDGLEVKRKGDKEFTARIKMELKNVPEKFMLSPQLSKLLGYQLETRPRIIAALWLYINSRKLEISNDPFSFICDPSLQMVFGANKMEFQEAIKKLPQHLSLPQPISLEHEIKLSGNPTSETECYDIQVFAHPPLDNDISSILAGRESQKQIEFYDDIISSYIKKVHEHQRRRAFFHSFSNSPEDFINASIASQSKDMKLVAGDASDSAENKQRSKFFNQPWVMDASIRYLNRKNAGNDAPGGS
ncbi:PREDICTED: SWI/SNF complex component SNF12 homolog [Lupinus angustifolius]|nr:PREDICTED: SWI/SNF complex component SNF12 homolog [Lupinus angustifolius]XP_019429260.1 PREDICTED: SWI/SNF complex component SNF12 homolog [Lupinus angustifolius]